VVVSLLIGWYYMAARISDERALSSRLAVQLSQLAESAKFVDREPGLVQEAILSSIQQLDPDVQHALRLQRTLRRIDPERQNSAQLLDRLAELKQMLVELQPVLSSSPTFWHLKGLLHKEQFLLEPKGDSSAWNELDRAFAAAITRYRASGGIPLILCHLDYANCLLALERADDAREHFTIASELAAADVPKWIAAESHFGLANAIRYADPESAGQELEQAIALVAHDEAYVSECGRYHLKLGWFHMDRWDWRRALEQFERAEAILSRPAEMDFAARIDWYHARHGKIMAGAYRDVDSEYQADHWHRAADNYRSLIEELLQLTGTSVGDVLTRRQRQLLRVRILNSYERRGDTLLTRPEIDAHDAELAAAYYREAAEFARGVSEYESGGAWGANLVRILSKQTAALAIASDLEEAAAVHQEAAEINCAAGFCSTRASLQLNLELAGVILELAKSTADERVAVVESLRKRITEVIRANQQSGWRPKRDDLEFLIFTKACLDQVAPEPESDRHMPLHRAVASMLVRYELHLAGFTPGVEPRVSLRPTPEQAGAAAATLELPQRFQFKEKGW
jgi:tetratricopeptide (TPR) repeat protein